MGERDPKYGYTFWATTFDSDFPIMFNYRDPVNDGQSIACEEYTSKTSAKGTEYLRLKGVKVLENSGSQEEAVPTPANQSIKSPNEHSGAAVSGQWKLVMSKLNDIHKDIKSLMGEDGVDKVAELTQGEVLGEEDINLDQIPF